MYQYTIFIILFVQHHHCYILNLIYCYVKGADPKFHVACQLFNPFSRCCQENYVPDWLPITNATAQKIFPAYLGRSEIERNLHSYVNARSTADVGSFNNVITIYAPKRLHFKYYSTRVALAILHWNENCRRARTRLEAKRDDDRNNRTRGARYLLKNQTFIFRKEIINHLFPNFFELC
jgi:hypothetical protein